MKNFLMTAVTAIGIATAAIGVAHAAGGGGGGGNGPTPGANAYFGQFPQPDLGSWTRVNGRIERADTAYDNDVAPTRTTAQR